MPRNAVKVSAAEGSIVVKAPITCVYPQWLRVENFPKFMTAMKEVQKIDARHFFIVAAYNGKRYEALLEIMLRVPERRVAWRVLAGRSSSDQLATGVVSFTSRSDGSTCVTLKISSTFNGDVSRRVDMYLHNFKRLIEEQRANPKTFDPSKGGVHSPSKEATENLTDAQWLQRDCNRVLGDA